MSTSSPFLLCPLGFRFLTLFFSNTAITQALGFDCLQLILGEVRWLASSSQTQMLATMENETGPAVTASCPMMCLRSLKSRALDQITYFADRGGLKGLTGLVATSLASPTPNRLLRRRPCELSFGDG